MFDKYYIDESSDTEYIPYEKKVTVNRAPTDKSVKLLKEFEHEALQKIGQAYFIESTDVKGILLTSRPHYSVKSFGDEEFILIFELNGKKHTIKRNFESWKFHNKDIEETPEKVFISVIKDYIFEEIIKTVKVKLQPEYKLGQNIK